MLSFLFSEINPNQSSIQTLLRDSISIDSLEMIKALLNLGAKITFQLVTYSIQFGNSTILNFLIEQCGGMNALKLQELHFEEKLLTVAARHGQIEIFESFRSKFTWINNFVLEKSLKSAILSFDLDMVKYLINTINNNNNNNESIFSPSILRQAVLVSCRKGSLAILKYFVNELSVEIDSKEDEGKCLVVATFYHRWDIVKYLLIEKSSFPNRKNEYGETPLTSACHKGNLEIVRLLLEKGADVNLPGSESESALWIASHRGHLEIVKILVDSGAALDVKNSAGQTPVWIAVCWRHFEIVKYLAGKGANLNLPNNQGNTPLLLCTGRLKDIECLVENGADVNLADKYGRTPLKANENFEDIVKYLLEKGAVTVKSNRLK